MVGPHKWELPHTTAALLDALSDPAVILNKAGVILTTNLAWETAATEQLCPISRLTVADNFFEACADAADEGIVGAERFLHGLNNLADCERHYNVEYLCPVGDVTRWFELRLSRIMDPDAQYLVMQVEVTEHKKREQLLLDLARTDPLTGLANRLELNERLQRALAYPAAGKPTSVGVAYLDIDGFKVINNTFGHAVGDAILTQLGRRLTSIVRENDLVARIGGDEFMIVIPDMTQADVAGFHERIHASTQNNYHVDGHIIEAQVSIGVHIARSGDTVAQVQQAADQLMYDRKKRTKKVMSLVHEHPTGVGAS